MKRKKRIFQIYYSYSKYGGLENYLDAICKLSKYHHVKININDDSYFKFSNFKFFSKTVQKIKNSQNLLHFHGFNPTILFELFIAKNENQRIIWTPHFHPPKYTKRIFLAYLNLIFAALFLFKKKFYIICQYSKEKNFLEKLFFNSIFYVIPTGHIKLKNKNYKKKFDGIYIARNEQNKNIDLYLKLVQKFKKKKFCLITNKIDIKLDNLKIYNNVNDIIKIKLISLSKFFINTSHFEAFGIASAEAELCGVPSIHNKDVYYHDLEKKNKFLLYKKNNLKSLSEVFLNLCKLKKKDYISLSRSRIRYSKKQIFENKISFFDSIYSLKNRNNLR